MESLPYSSTDADRVCELCLWYVCMRTSAVFLFKYLKIFEARKTDLFMTCVFNPSLGRHPSLLMERIGSELASGTLHIE